MAWTQVGLITLTTAWQFVPQTESKILRLRRVSSQSGVSFAQRGYLARAVQSGGEWQFWGNRRLYMEVDAIILDFREEPVEMEGSILALHCPKWTRQPWQVAIDIPESQGATVEPEPIGSDSNLIFQAIKDLEAKVDAL
jgi:hypothetical protein